MRLFKALLLSLITFVALGQQTPNVIQYNTTDKISRLYSRSNIIEVLASWKDSTDANGSLFTVGATRIYYPKSATRNDGAVNFSTGRFFYLGADGFMKFGPMPIASASASGFLNNTDWSLFNSKPNTSYVLTGDLSGTLASPSVLWANGYTTYDARYARKNGTSSQFIMGDGSFNSNTYLQTETDPVIRGLIGLIRSNGTTASATIIDSTLGLDGSGKLQVKYPTKVVTGTTYTLTNSDYGYAIHFTNASLVTLTLPTTGLRDGFIAFPLAKTNKVRLTTTGTFERNNDTIVGPNGFATVHLYAANTWLATGSLGTVTSGGGGGGAPTGPAGGDLTGSYPNPTIASGAINSSKIQDGSVANVDLANSAITVNGVSVPLGGSVSVAPATTSKRFNITAGSVIDFFGDSYVFGPNTPSTSNLVPMLSDNLECAFNNYGVNGQGWKNVLTNAFTNVKTGRVIRNPAYVSTGINELKTSLNGVYEGGKSGCRAFLANHFLKSAVAANNAVITTSGTWTTTSGINDKASIDLGGLVRQSSVAGSTLNYTFTGDNIVIGTFNTDETAFFTGTFTIAIDGTAVYTHNGKNKAMVGNSSYGQLISDAIVLTNLGAGSHTLVITTNENIQTRIDYIGLLGDAQSFPPVIINATPKQNAAGYAANTSGANEANFDTYIAGIKSVCAEFPSHFPIHFIDTNPFRNFITDMNPDNVHWNTEGAKIAVDVTMRQSDCARNYWNYNGFYTTDDPKSTTNKLFKNQITYSSTATNGQPIIGLFNSSATVANGTSTLNRAGLQLRSSASNVVGEIYAQSETGGYGPSLRMGTITNTPFKTYSNNTFAQGLYGKDIVFGQDVAPSYSWEFLRNYTGTFSWTEEPWLVVRNSSSTQGNGTTTNNRASITVRTGASGANAFSISQIDNSNTRGVLTLASGSTPLDIIIGGGATRSMVFDLNRNVMVGGTTTTPTSATNSFIIGTGGTAQTAGAPSISMTANLINAVANTDALCLVTGQSTFFTRSVFGHRWGLGTLNPLSGLHNTKHYRGDSIAGTGNRLLYATAGGIMDDLPDGTTNQVLTTNGAGVISWATPSTGFTNPMTSQGDIIVGGTSGAATRVGIGAAGTYPKSTGSTLTYGNFNTDVQTFADTRYLQLAGGTLAGDIGSSATTWNIGNDLTNNRHTFYNLSGGTTVGQELYTKKGNNVLNVNLSATGGSGDKVVASIIDQTNSSLDRSIELQIGQPILINGPATISGVVNTSSLLRANSDVYVTNISNGVIMKSPDGTCWRLTPSNAGAAVFTSVTCP